MGYDFEMLERGNGKVSFIHGKLTLNRQEGAETIYMTLIYMPSVADYRVLLTLLERIFNDIPKGSKHITMGDFNIDMFDENVVSDAYNDLLESYNYFVANDNITRSRIVH